ncbi:putative reverse transcriptase domain-containing protein [Tanacetum coccineum]
MPPRRNMNINDVEHRIIARMEERLDHFIDQLADRINDMMNPRRREDRNGRRSEGEKSKNMFFEGDGSSSDEQPDRPRTFFAEPEEWEDDGVADNDYEEDLVFDDDQYEEEIVSGDVRVNLMVRRSCLTLKVVGDDWLKHNIFQSTCTILGKVCTFVVDPESCDNLIAEEADELEMGDHVKAWDRKLYQAEFAHNHTVNRSTGFSPFQVVYSAQPHRPLDLIALHVSGFVPKKVQDLVEGLHEVHKAVRDNLVRANSKYKQDSDQKRRHVDFEVGDFVRAVLTKDRFLVGEFNKLSAKKIGLLEIVKKINSNAYRLKLPSHIQCSDVFNVKHLLPYHGDSSDDDLVGNSRTNFVYPWGNDAGPSVEERALLFLDAQDRVKKMPLFKMA